MSAGRSPVYPDGKKIRLYAAIGSAIRARRQAIGMSVPALAAAVGVSVSTLANYQDGITPPTLIALTRLRRALGCSLDELVPAFGDEVAA